MEQRISHQEILESLQKVAQAYGTKRMAADLGKAPATLYGELNPYSDDTSRHKLGLQDAMNIMSMTGDYEPLRLMCAACGFTMSRVGCEPVMAIVAYQGLTAVMSEVGELAQALQNGLADGKLSHSERVEIARQAQDITHALEPFLAVE